MLHACVAHDQHAHIFKRLPFIQHRRFERSTKLRVYTYTLTTGLRCKRIESNSLENHTMVYVLPVPVWPYANIVALKPLRTSSTIGIPTHWKMSS
jgi:hypothetical protein